MLNGDGNKNGKQKSSRSNQQEPCTCSALFSTFLCRCFARLQREASKLQDRKCRMCSCSLFFFLLPLISFHLGGRQHSPPPLQNFSAFLSTKFLSLFIISRSGSFSVIHISVDIKLKLSLGFVAIFSQNTKMFEMQNYIPAYVKGWTHCTDIRKGNFLDAQVTKFSTQRTLGVWRTLDAVYANPRLRFVLSLRNCREFSQSLSCLYQAIQTWKTLSIA